MDGFNLNPNGISVSTETVRVDSDLELRDRKPTGEPRNKKYLYAPGSQYQLGEGEGGAIDGEIVK